MMHPRTSQAAAPAAPVDIEALSRRLGLGEDHVVREVFQARLLSEIFNQTVHREVVLKGGLAMRTAFGSPRLTKDIDLQSDPRVAPARTASLIRQAIRATVRTGLVSDVVVTEPKQTDTVQRWKINGRVGETHVNLTVELSRRGLPPTEHMSTVRYEPDAGYGVRPVMVESFSASAMAAGKVAALLGANRVAPRDLYDLDLLIGHEIEPPVELLSRMGVEELQEKLQLLWDKIELMDYETARDALVDYLPAEAGDRIDRETWETMRIRTGQAIEGWLEGALELAKAPSGP